MTVSLRKVQAQPAGKVLPSIQGSWKVAGGSGFIYNPLPSNYFTNTTLTIHPDMQPRQITFDPSTQTLLNKSEYEEWYYHKDDVMCSRCLQWFDVDDCVALEVKCVSDDSLPCFNIEVCADCYENVEES